MVGEHTCSDQARDAGSDDDGMLPKLSGHERRASGEGTRTWIDPRFIQGSSLAQRPLRPRQGSSRPADDCVMIRMPGSVLASFETCCCRHGSFASGSMTKEFAAPVDENNRPGPGRAELNALSPQF